MFLRSVSYFVAKDSCPGICSIIKVEEGNANSTPKAAANFTIAICNLCLEDCSSPQSNFLKNTLTIIFKAESPKSVNSTL